MNVVAALSMTAGALGAQGVDYGRDVRPILADRCYACHGPDSATREADLRLDLRADAIADRGGFPAIVPGDAEASELILRIRDHMDPMPPGPDHEPLEAHEVEVLASWIASGAPFDVHWAYEAPLAPAPPTVRDAKWPSGEVDRFVLARLEAAGITPAPRADPRTLVRRLSFDLLGLPPTYEQVQAFAADPSSAAWSALVEQMLASPHHAERLATFWFDHVRFADTTGIHADNTWNVSPYRDWVVDAFASNMPFDQFTVEQLAGDLLPNATRSQQVASAYNRLNLITREGGSQPKEFLARYTADRVRNVSEAWLATTLGCAECHDHKFDPLSTREFYEMGAFFADIEQVGVYSQSGRNNFGPELAVPAESQEKELGAIESEIKALDDLLAADSPGLVADRLEWEHSVRNDEWQVPQDISFLADAGTQAEMDAEGVFVASGEAPERDTYRLSFTLPGESDAPIRALRLELLPHASLAHEGPGRAKNGNLVLTEVELFLDGEPVAIAGADPSYEQPGYALEKALDGKLGSTGWAVMTNNMGTPAEAVFELAQPARAAQSGAPGLMEIVLRQEYGSQHTLGSWRVTSTTTKGRRAVAPRVRELIARDPTDRTGPDRTGPERAEIEALHRSQTPFLANERASRTDLIRSRDALRAKIPLVLQTRAVEPMMTRVLSRGNWMDESGAVVEPSVPQVLGAVKSTGPRPTRLDLAHWMVDGDNPLVARVLVNRIWRLLLGRGLVETLDDFGVQGAAPTHPQLLDHLALELVDSGWDLRHIIRTIVTSSTYAQAATTSATLDPGNEWFGRQERFRIDAEFVRDGALAASGLLVRDIGGPSVRPYQPEGYWAHLNFPARVYVASTGDDLYRRALYGHWQRQYLHPSLLAFDAPSRERCTCERPRSNTPQAALALLNDPIFVEAARVLAGELLRSGEESGDAQVTWLWRRVLQRDPREAEISSIFQLVASHRAHYAAHEDEARELLGVGASPRDESLAPYEHAAWTSAARVVLNLHETIVRN
ncbi:MAG: hypothetical protein ACJAQ3_003052 [Planctomycetota bacterium]|jgi:hypothetical protein